MRTPSFRVDGRKALVSGGSRGIGLAAAHALAQMGADVVIAARGAAELDSACRAIEAEGGKARPWQVDVTDSKAVTEGIARLGPFRILVNSAGTNRPALLSETSDEDLDFVVDVNVKAVFYMTRAVTDSMVRAGLNGSVINVSSQMGHVGGPRRTVYCATKHAMEGFTKALAWELGSKQIRVNTLCPTFIETDLTRPMFEDKAFRDYVTSRIALGHLGQLEDVMGAVTFLASDAAAMVTGTALVVDGGWTAA